ncbi:hypothetical protein EV140_1525 [Microcella alkaliphila]|uniref:Uncharacterized protein n=1 Tax=Microcella alkaliphila TaxID=279828 RepID=A0A4Q7TGE2_9MICO|nr:hypothetical protein [Microcella alkaliphila]RZT59545.1 hypothetical protein EV140_1525 [Microcella alkaliphila]
MAETTSAPPQPIVTLTINPALDVSTSTERVRPQHKMRCGPSRLDVTARDGVEDTLVLVDHIAECEQPMRLHLPGAQFDLAHEQPEQARQSWGPLSFDERAVKGNVGAGEGRGVLLGRAERVGELALRSEHARRHGRRAGGDRRGEVGECGDLERGAVGVEVYDVVARERGHARGLVRGPAWEPFGDESFECGLRGGARDPEAIGDRLLGDGGAGLLALGQDALAQRLVHGVG